MIAHGNTVTVTVMVIVSVTDEDVIARNIIGLCRFPCITRKKRIDKQHDIFMVQGKARMPVINEFHIFLSCIFQ